MRATARPSGRRFRPAATRRWRPEGTPAMQRKARRASPSHGPTGRTDDSRHRCGRRTARPAREVHGALSRAGQRCRLRRLMQTHRPGQSPPRTMTGPPPCWSPARATCGAPGPKSTRTTTPRPARGSAQPTGEGGRRRGDTRAATKVQRTRTVPGWGKDSPESQRLSRLDAPDSAHYITNPSVSSNIDGTFRSVSQFRAF